MTKIKISRNVNGGPCLWEGGGGYTNTGNATIITDKNGGMKVPTYIKRKGTLACAEHALIPVEVGDYVIQARHHRLDYDITVSSIVEIDGEYAILDEDLIHSEGQWTIIHAIKDNQTLFTMMQPAIKVASNKAKTYHCREAMYVKLCEINILAEVTESSGDCND